MLVDPSLYRKVFQAYLRTGTPIEWSIKQERPTTHYIWRTRGDDKVRPSHAANKDRFSRGTTRRRPGILVRITGVAVRLSPTFRKFPSTWRFRQTGSVQRQRGVVTTSLTTTSTGVEEVFRLAKSVTWTESLLRSWIEGVKH